MRSKKHRENAGKTLHVGDVSGQGGASQRPVPEGQAPGEPAQVVPDQDLGSGPRTRSISRSSVSGTEAMAAPKNVEANTTDYRSISMSMAEGLAPQAIANTSSPGPNRNQVN